MARLGPALVAAAAALVLLRPTPALAHAVVVGSDPPDPCAAASQPTDAACASGVILAAPPATIRVRFSESVEPFGDPVRVLDPSGRRVERGTARIVGSEVSVDVDASAQGTYVVRWQVVSDDTHPSRRSFRFSVGHPSPVAAAGAGDASSDLGAVAPIGLAFQLLARWLHFTGFALGFGVLAFVAFARSSVGAGQGGHAGPPLPQITASAGDTAGVSGSCTGGPACPPPSSSYLLPEDPAIDRRLGRLVNLGILALLLAEPLALLGQTGSLGASQLLDPDTVSAAFDSSFGRALALRLGAALLLWTLVGVEKGGSGAAPWLALVGGIVLAGLDGTSAHAVSGRWPALGLVANALHLSAMGLWIGGLVALASVWGQSALRERRWQLAARFGGVVVVCLAVLAISGLVLALQHLGAPGDLVTAAYGRTLLAKLGLVAVALAIAVVATRVKPGGADRWRQAEAVVLLGVLALAGLLVSLPPPI